MDANYFSKYSDETLIIGEFPESPENKQSQLLDFLLTERTNFCGVKTLKLVVITELNSKKKVSGMWKVMI